MIKTNRWWLIMIAVWLVGGPTVPGNAQTTHLPGRIMINPLEDATTGVAITWRVDQNDAEQYIQWAEAQIDPVKDLARFQEKVATGKKDTVHYDGNTSVFYSYRVKLTGLEPGKTYMYRVGNENTGWSEWIQFDLPQADPDSELTFIYLGDPQNDLRSQWSRVIREAYATAPEADFILYAGDLVNKGYNDAEWQEWYEAGGFIHRMLPSILTPGNHEFTNVKLTPLWRSHFTLPANGPTGLHELEGTCFYVDYPNLRVISLDGEQIDEDPQMRLAMVRWLESILEDNPKQWTVMTMHYPFYHTRPDRYNPKLSTAFKPIVDKYGVDLILQGHDHGYGRGMLDAQNTGPVEEGTMYVVSVSGPKMYEVGQGHWIEKRGENLQLYQVIKILGDRLEYKSYSTEGVLFDKFILKKSDKGSQLVEK